MSRFNHFVDFNYINALVFHNLNKIPKDIDLIIGIPRSGLIISTMIAEYIGKPSTDLFGFLYGIKTELMAFSSIAPQVSYDNIKHILLVDDGVGLGTSMKKAKNMVINKYPNLKITTYSPFVEPFSTDKVDIYCTVLRDQFMPWSIMKRGIEVACVDIDGVLTEDVPAQFDTDDENYITFLRNQKPMFRPDRPIHTLVSGRLEKYREITEEWLNKNNITYKHLILLNLPNKYERSKINVGEYKANVYRNSGTELFIESDFNEANTIHNLTKMPVFCTAVCDMLKV